jgi:hypothetical protein
MCGRPHNSVTMACTICALGAHARARTHTHTQTPVAVFRTICSINEKQSKPLLLPVPRQCSCKVMNVIRVSSRAWLQTPGLMNLDISGPQFCWNWKPDFFLHKNATCRASVRWCAIYNVEFLRRSIVSCSGWRQEVQIGKHLPAVGKHSSRTVITTGSRRKPGMDYRLRSDRAWWVQTLWI